MDKMKNSSIKILVALALVLGYAVSMTVYAQDDTTAAKPTYVGANKCMICHKGDKHANIWETWEGSAHAKSMDVLKDDEKTNPECLACHTTGYGEGGYGAEGMAELELGNVGCEACHGPGSEYKSMKVMKDKDAAIAAGLIIPTAETCVRCHNEKSPTFKGFDFDEYWAKIKHGLPAADESGEKEGGE
jgi:hypothetical protein